MPITMMRYGPDKAQPLPEAWKGKMALLIDGGCTSACEDFVLRFKDGDRGLVLGEPTFGSTGQPYFVEFRNSSCRSECPPSANISPMGVSSKVLEYSSTSLSSRTRGPEARRRQPARTCSANRP